MAGVRPNQSLVPSVLDRLMADDPSATRGVPASGHQILRDVKMAVCRDLENLLNTRWRCLSLRDDFEELKKQSLVNYGIPDISGASLGTVEGRDDFCRLLERTIRQYEPRFQTVKLTAQNPQPDDRIFRFRIDALLIAEPAPEPIVFDSELLPRTGTFAVKEVAD
jgi:type VI secretion system protein ImpF